MNRLLKALRVRHSILDTRVSEEQRRPLPDPIRLGALKKIRLQLRDQIASLERLLGQGAAPVANRLRSKRRTVTT